MFAVPSVRGAARVLSRWRAVAAIAGAAAVTFLAPLWAAVILAPLAAVVVGVLVPFALLWCEFEYEVPLEYWDTVYRKQYGTAGVVSRGGPRGVTPPVYPNGWFKIAESDEVPPRGVKCVRFMGAELVLFRGPTGTLGLVDAHCPHLGAHLGVGGAVTSDGCLQCPFHGWKFGPDGRCVEIPYSTGSVPAQAATRAHRVMETHRIVLVWYDAEGREPPYTLRDAWPEIPSNYNRVGRATHHIPCHISEVPENGADVTHLNFLHTDVHPVMRWLKPLIDMKESRFDSFSKFVWTATWEPSEARPEYADMRLTERFVVRGSPVPLVGSDATIRQVGPGLVVLDLQTFFGRVTLMQSLTPVEPYHMRLETTAFCSPNIGNLTLANRLMLLAYAENVERDVLIWGKKQYLQSPMVVKGDGPIPRFRRWYAQFYSPSSPTWESVSEKARAAAPLPEW